MKIRLSLLAAVAVLSACSTEPPEQFGIVVDGSRIQVIDLHTHSGTWEPVGKPGPGWGLGPCGDPLPDP